MWYIKNFFKNNSKPVYNKKLLKIKIKSYGDLVTDFCDKEIPKVNFNHTCLAVISLDSAFRKRWELLSSNIFERM